jgi:hypothetical protein
MENKIQKPKLRVQLLDEELRVMEDRLVDQASEFYLGPKKSHKGPLKFEVTFQTQNDIDDFKTYLSKIKGEFPIKEVSQRGRPSTSSSQTLESPREDILVKVQDMVNSGDTQDNIIKYLRKLGFIFLLTEDFLRYFPEFKFNPKDIGNPNDTGQYLDSFAWLTRCIKRAKDPKADKYDKMITFGFRIEGKPSSKIIPYLYGDRKDILRSKKSNKKTSFASYKELTKFPHFMLEDERLKFSTEMRQLLANEEKKPSKFFLRWFKDVQFPKDLQEPMEKIYSR